VPHQPWRSLSFHSCHGAPLPAPPHTTINQHAGWPLCALVPGVGHHGSCCRPFRSQPVTDIVGLLWVVSYVGICRVMYQAINNVYPTRWQWASSLALEPLAGQPKRQIGHNAASSRKGHCGGMMCGNGGSEIEGRGTGGEDSYNRQIFTLIDHGGLRILWLPWGPTLGF
jgi:hypothetical protein